MWLIDGGPTRGDVALQSTLATATQDLSTCSPHHPIQCLHSGNLYFEEDNSLHCDHASASPDDARTLAALQTSIAILILELACQKYLAPAVPGGQHT